MILSLKSHHTVIPVNCHKITRTILQVNTKMQCSHRQWRSLFLPVKHHSHISFKIPVNTLTSLTRNDLLTAVSLCCVCKHGGVYVVSVFVDVFTVSNIHIHAAAFGVDIILDNFKPNCTAWDVSSASECYDWPRVDVYFSMFWSCVCSYQ